MREPIYSTSVCDERIYFETTHPTKLNVMDSGGDKHADGLESFFSSLDMIKKVNLV